MKRLALASAAIILGSALVAPATVLARSGSCAPASSIAVVAQGNAFDKACYAAPAGVAFKIVFNNEDPFSHNFGIYTKQGGDPLFQGKYVPKASTVTYDVPKQRNGSYYFQCDIHPFMNGTFMVGASSAPSAKPSTPDRAPAGPSVTLVKVADGFVAPVFSTGAGDGSGRLFVVDQTGSIWIVDKGGHVLGKPFLDIHDKLVKQKANYDERGLLGLAFHPNFKKNGRFFVWYSAPLRAGAPKGWDNTIHLSEFHVQAGDPNLADAGSERIVMQIDHPQANHNSGHIAFGPDGYLYTPIGDGGNANDVGLGHPPLGNAQDLTTILGNILRLDVDHAGETAYSIPADNPYAGGKNGARPEIFANGFRNPYHISFDAGGDHMLYAADAGQDRFEEVDAVRKGGNYGWHIKEGTHCFDPRSPSFAPKTCASTAPNGDPLIDPIIEYNHTEILGSVIIGGYVYRGKDIPSLEGKYVFGDYSRNRIKADGTLFAAEPKSGGLWDIKELQVRIADDPDRGPGFGRFVIAFGQGDDREIYVSLTGRGGPEGKSGAVYRLAADESSGGSRTGSSGWPWAILSGTITLLLIGGGAGLMRQRRKKNSSA